MVEQIHVDASESGTVHNGDRFRLYGRELHIEHVFYPAEHDEGHGT
jgi:hypothetical protein